MRTVDLYGCPCERCQWQDNDLICCRVHNLSLALRELLQSIPWIGEWFNDYKCYDYEPYFDFKLNPE